jgi:hypothetical protein
MGWWFFTRSAIEALTEPADAAACDREVGRLARDSAIGSAAHRIGQFAREGWAASYARALVIAIARDLTPAPPAAAWRVRGWIACVAGVTILLLNWMKPVPIGPLAWLLPSAITAAGVLTMIMAGPLSRAAADRRAHGIRAGDVSR